ncbi:MAG: hypothetical protein AAB517_02440, partial [Patescibacteria group bacterium]
RDSFPVITPFVHVGTYPTQFCYFFVLSGGLAPIILERFDASQTLYVAIEFRLYHSRFIARFRV